jgi:hypothetical protein
MMFHVPALLNELFPDQLRISPRVSIAQNVSQLYRAERLLSFLSALLSPYAHLSMLTHKYMHCIDSLSNVGALAFVGDIRIKMLGVLTCVLFG